MFSKKILSILLFFTSFAFGQFSFYAPSLNKATVLAMDSLGTVPSNVYAVNQYVCYDIATRRMPNYETILLFQRMAVLPAFPTYPDMSAIDTVIFTLKSDLTIVALRQKFDFFYMFCMPTQQVSNLNWVFKNSAYDATAVNGITWTANVGYTPASTKYITSNLNTSTNCVAATKNSNLLSTYTLDNITEASGTGLYNGSTGFFLAPHYNSSGAIGLANDANGGFFSTGAGNKGIWCSERSSSSAEELIFNGTLDRAYGSGGASQNFPNLIMYIGAENSSGTAVSFQTTRIASASFGAYTGNMGLSISGNVNNFLKHKSLNTH